MTLRKLLQLSRSLYLVGLKHEALVFRMHLIKCFAFFGGRGAGSQDVAQGGFELAL